VPVRGQLGAGWVRVLDDDPVSGVDMNLYYTPDLATVTPVADENDYRWPLMEVCGILESGTGKVFRFNAGNLYYGSRDLTHGRTIWQQNQPAYDDTTLTAPYPIRGIGGGSGTNFVKGQQCVQLSDDFYYLFMTETRQEDYVIHTPAWTKVWAYTTVPKPTGVWYDPTDSANIRVASGSQKKVYKVRQSDGVVLSSTAVLTTHAIVGITGDPADSSIYWILEGPWYDSSTAPSRIHKVDKATNTIISSVTLTNTKWTDIQASSTYLWLTNYDTDKIHKFNKSGVMLSSYSIYHGGVRQYNPNGTAVFGSTLYYFFANSGRILVASESAPTTITQVISTNGFKIYGGEFDDTRAFLWASIDSTNTVYKFDLVSDQVIDVPDGGSNLGDLQLWIRSKDLFHWSAPVVGPGIVNPKPIAGIEESGGYAYWADNGSVWRRPMTPLEYDVSNFTTEVTVDNPRDNQSGKGTALIANPDGINDDLLELGDKDLTLEVGIKNTLGVYEFVEFNRYFVDRVVRQVSGETNRLKVLITDVWGRLESPLQDVYNVVGKTDWDDWDTDLRNEAFNYYFAQDTAPTIVGNDLRTTGICLYTGWKGHNPNFYCTFSTYSGSTSLIARYVDSSNYIKITKSYDKVYLYEVVAGVVTTIASVTISSIIGGYVPSNSDTVTLKAILKWNSYEIYMNGNLMLSGSRNWTITDPGYAGFVSSSAHYQISTFHLEDWEYDVQISDMIKTALALGDVHDVVVNNAEEKAYAIIWGPQTDLPTAAEALRQFLASLKLQLAYRGGILTADKFNDPDPIYTYDDIIIQTDQTEEPQKKINWSSVDGNDTFWLEVDVSDSRKRGRQIVGYSDLPELLTIDSVKARAQEELRRASEGVSPSGMILMQFDLWRMDPITWVDNAGNSKDVRVEGFELEIRQGTQPSQRMKVDTSLLADTVDA
jgi:hypothetical protein